MSLLFHLNVEDLFFSMLSEVKYTHDRGLLLALLDFINSSNLLKI